MFGLQAGFVPPAQHVERVDVRGMSPQHFAAEFDAPSRPAVLQGAMEGWDTEAWTLDALLHR